MSKYPQIRVPAKVTNSSVIKPWIKPSITTSSMKPTIRLNPNDVVNQENTLIKGIIKFSTCHKCNFIIQNRSESLTCPTCDEVICKKLCKGKK